MGYYITEDGEWVDVTYEELVARNGTILVQVDDNDYQGDTRILLRSGDRYGFLIFGWGSCSGCDALEACGSKQDVEDLAADLARSIQWFDTAAETLAYLESKDPTTEFYYRDGQEWRDFMVNCRSILDPYA